MLIRELSEENRRNFPINLLVNEIYLVLTQQWAKAGFDSEAILSELYIKSNIKCLWQEGMKISTGRVKIEAKNNFMKKLDKVFDISFCKCKIELCPEKKCTCKDNVHIKCVCPKERKLPVLELRFLKSQRDKVGSIGQLQIGNPDIPVTKKQQEALERKEKDKICEEKRKVRIEEARRKEQSLQLAVLSF